MVTDNARAKWEHYCHDYDVHPSDLTVSHRAFFAGWRAAVEWAAGRTGTTDERVVHNHGPTDGPGLDCPETILPDGGLRGACLNRAETTTATVEDTARAIAAWALDFAGLGVGIYLNGETIGDPHGPWDVPTDAADSLAAWLNARGLLATARTRPTREHLAEAIMDSDTIPCDVCDDSRCHYCRADAYRKADAVLALLADQPDPADVWDEAVEKIREQHPACEDPCEMCAEMDDWLTALADNPYRAGGA